MLLAAVLLVLALWQGQLVWHRYVSPEEALAMRGSVQVMGTLAVVGEEKIMLVGADGTSIELSLPERDRLRAESGLQVVAIGRVTEGRLLVNRLLYKCPGKYEREGG